MAHVHVGNMLQSCPFHCLGMYRITREENYNTCYYTEVMTALRIIKTKNVVYIPNYFLLSFSFLIFL